MKIPISIVTGYLGSGKTTFLLHLLENSGKRIAVVMNEFGDINIDSAIVKGKNVDMIELSGGCVCCSITGEFDEAVKEIVKKARPDIIVLETTGVADPEPIIYDVRENLKNIVLDSVITLVDASEIVEFPSLGETARSQIRLADVIILNKSDLVGEDDLRKVENTVRSLNDTAIIFQTVKGRVDPDLLFGFYGKKPAEKKQHEEIEDMESFVFTSDKRWEKAKFKEFMKSLPPQIYRAKGFVLLWDGEYLFNYVNGRSDLEKHPAAKTELVFIGKDASKAKDDVIKKLNAL